MDLAADKSAQAENWYDSVWNTVSRDHPSQLEALLGRARYCSARL
jgi:hypothetical protein